MRARDNQLFLQADNLGARPGVKHGFFTRAGGARRFFEGMRFICCRQVHSAGCLTVAGEAWGENNQPEADAMVSREKGIVLKIITADCVPVLFADVKAEIIGAAHAGWRGALSGIIENTVKAMEALGASRHGITAALGPCIWQQSYEVGPEFPVPFLDEDRNNAELFVSSPRAGHYLFDLPGYVIKKLRRCGVTDISPSPADTFTDEKRFFSYRRDCLRGAVSTGRLVSAIALTA